MTVDIPFSTIDSTQADVEARPTKQAKIAHSTMASTSTLRLLVQRHPSHPLAKLPTRGSAAAAGYDLYASEKVLLPKGGRKVVQTGICLAIPTGHYGRVAPRSGLASKHGIDVGAGVIDEDYRGLLGVLLFNLGDADFESELHARPPECRMGHTACCIFPDDERLY
ncbi:dUTP diphosphatase [Testicularia cyperi]|uniref:Deoxyuridine 5'-triphosphate nucleotidohydrolase n=1 Tax=Testicularia cyperi TaxID=1882483 RepID=A0A317XQ10_9BASI|nr:dUTP diphosphatase [Testicularia cyperi]